MSEQSAMTPKAGGSGQGRAPIPPRKERGSLLRYGAALSVIAILLGVGVYFLIGHDDLPPPRQVREFTVVNIVPPPPPPPPPPPSEQKMIEQPKLTDHEFKSEDKPVEKPKDEPAKDNKDDKPPAPLSLDAKPVGPSDLFNLGGKPGGSPYGGGGGGPGSQWGWYSAKVQEQVRTVLAANQKTRYAKVRIEIRLWADAAGRVNRVQLVTSTGDAELDAAIRDNALNGLVLQEPPPKGMPMPINTRITETRPS